MHACRSLTRAVFVVIALGPCAGAHAMNESASSSELQQLVGDARASLQRLRDYLYSVEVDLARSSSQMDMRGGRMMGASPSFRDLDRESERLSSVASQISTVVARCGKDGARLGSGMKSAARRVKNGVDRIASAGSFESVRMATDKVRTDTDLAERNLMAAMQMQGCVQEGAKDGGEDDEEEQDDAGKDGSAGDKKPGES